MYPEGMKLIENSQYNDKFILTHNEHNEVYIFSYEDLQLIYKIPPLYKRIESFHACRFTSYEDPKYSNHVILCGFHIDVFDLHRGLNPNNIFWWSIQPLMERAFEFLECHIEFV